MELRDSIIVITGAASGIGRGLAQRFHEEGARQIVCADLNEAGAQATAKSIGGIAMAADVALEDDVRRLVEDTEEQVGPIDLFVSRGPQGFTAKLLGLPG